MLCVLNLVILKVFSIFVEENKVLNFLWKKIFLKKSKNTCL